MPPANGTRIVFAALDPEGGWESHPCTGEIPKYRFPMSNQTGPTGADDWGQPYISLNIPNDESLHVSREEVVVPVTEACHT